MHNIFRQRPPPYLKDFVTFSVSGSQRRQITSQVRRYPSKKNSVWSTDLFSLRTTQWGAHVATVVKKPALDREKLSINYRPISNLSLISKIIERVVKFSFMDHLTSNSLLNSHHQPKQLFCTSTISWSSATGSQKVSYVCCFRHY